MFLSKGNFSYIIVSVLLPDYVGFLKIVLYISVTKKRPIMGPSLLNCKPVNILFSISAWKEINLKTNFIHSTNKL